jgi:hypothetical protein
MRRLLIQRPLPPTIKPEPLSPEEVQQLRETAVKFKAASEQITVVETWKVADLVLQAGKLFAAMVALGLKQPTVEDWLALHKTALKSPLWPREQEQFKITVDRFNSTIASNITSQVMEAA